MDKLTKILSVLISFGVIGSAIAGTLYHLDRKKVDVTKYIEFVQEHKKYCAYTDVRFLEQYRRNLQQRVWDLQRRYPNDYQQRPEYLNLIEELKRVDMKIRAFYNRGN